MKSDRISPYHSDNIMIYSVIYDAIFGSLKQISSNAII